MPKRRISRAILIDKEGYFLAALQWPAGRGSTPNIPKQTRLLFEDAALAVESSDARWNKKKGAWEYPSVEIFLFREKDGTYAGRKKVWPDRYVVPFGLDYTREPVPEERHYKPIWDGKKWTRAKRVVVIDAEDQPQVVLENPRSDTPNVADLPGVKLAPAKVAEGLLSNDGA